MTPKKLFSVFLIALMFSGLAFGFCSPANAQSSKPASPSVPEFTVKYVDLSYDVLAATSINQYTGKTVTTQGYHVENRTIQLTMKNQPYNPIQNGLNVSFYYNVREKGQYSASTENWITIYNPGLDFPKASKSDYTILYFLIDENDYPFWDHLLNGGTVDFQVQAMVGAVHRISNITGDVNQPQFEMFPWVFDGQTSDWSGTQTIIVPANVASSPTSTPQPSSQNTISPTQSGTNPTVPQISWVEIVAFAILGVVVALLALVIVSMRRRIRGLERKL